MQAPRIISVLIARIGIPAVLALVMRAGAAPGDLDTAFVPNVGGVWVGAMATQPDGKIVIAGNFAAVNGTNRSCVARLLGDGSLESS